MGQFKVRLAFGLCSESSSSNNRRPAHTCHGAIKKHERDRLELIPLKFQNRSKADCNGKDNMNSSSTNKTITGQLRTRPSAAAFNRLSCSICILSLALSAFAG